MRVKSSIVIVRLSAFMVDEGDLTSWISHILYDAETFHSESDV